MKNKENKTLNDLFEKIDKIISLYHELIDGNPYSIKSRNNQDIHKEIRQKEEALKLDYGLNYDFEQEKEDGTYLRKIIFKIEGFDSINITATFRTMY